MITVVPVASDDDGAENPQFVGNCLSKSLTLCGFFAPGKELPTVGPDPVGISVTIFQTLFLSLRSTATAHQ